MGVRAALGITAATRITVFVFSLASVAVVSRLLTPEEIGVFSVSVAVIGLAHVFRDFGVGQYLIQVREVTLQARRAAFTVTLAFSCAIAALLYLGRHAAAAFYGNPGVGEVMALLALNFLILPFAAPLRTILHREMQFGKLAVFALINQVVQSCTTIAAAWAGASYLSMAWGSIAGNLANLAVLAVLFPGRAFERPTLAGLREVLSFGSKSSAASLSTQFGAAAPDLILGRTLGFADVAYYSRASGMVHMSVGQLLYVVGTVYTPAFARGYRAGENPAELYARTSSLLLGITVPAMALLALLAGPLIALLFGPQWERSAPLGSLLFVYALIGAPFTLAATSLTATGHVGAVMRCRLVIEASRILVLLASLRYALEIVVALLGLVSVMHAVVFMRALRRAFGLRSRTLWAGVRGSYALAPFALAGPLAMFAANRLAGPVADLWVIAASVAFAFLGWLAGIAWLKHPLRAEVVSAARAVRARLWSPAGSASRRDDSGRR